MVTESAADGCTPIALYPSETDLAERVQEAIAARRTVATAARIRDLEALMTEQNRAAQLERDLADMIYQRDLTLARNAAIEADRDHWRAMCDWSESVLIGRQRYVTALSARYQRLRAARRRDRVHMVWLLLTTLALCLATAAMLLAGPLLTAFGVVLP